MGEKIWPFGWWGEDGSNILMLERKDEISSANQPPRMECRARPLPGTAVFPAVSENYKGVFVCGGTAPPLEGRAGFEPASSRCAAGVLPKAPSART